MILPPMRKPQLPTSSFLRWRSLLSHPSSPTSVFQQLFPTRRFAQVRPEPWSELWFTSSIIHRGPADELLGNGGSNGDHKPPDERTLKLGKTLRLISPLLPNILSTPLPQEILSPSISLHLFPSTHPHLPAVKGRVPYRAALWTAPVAWGCVPLVGNTKLDILSEKIVRTGFALEPQTESSERLGDEKLVVRWQTKRNGTALTTDANPAASSSSSADATNGRGMNRGLSALLGGDKPIVNLNGSESFSGLFIFSFDLEGRIAQHTIEHADENNGFDRTSKVVTLADWLLGKAKWSRKEDELLPGLAIRVCQDEWRNRGRVGHILEPETVPERIRDWRARW